MPVLRQLGLLALIAGGCESEEIRTYRVAREPASVAPAATVSAQRVLVAVIPGEDKVWFIKMSGPGAKVEGQRQAFLGLVR